MSEKKKNRLSVLLLLALLFAASPSARSQVWEDFGDGDFYNNPAWRGDTTDFRINSNHQLQLYTEGADSSQLSFPYTMPENDTLTWEFWIRLAFTPTYNNYALTTLYSDSADLLKASQYLMLALIDPSASGRKIGIYQNDSLLCHLPYSPNASNNPLRFRIQMSDRQRLDIWIDTIGNADTICYAYAGNTATISATLPSSAYFGLYCHYTSSRSKHFYIDDIGINADQIADTSTQDSTVTPILSRSDVLVNEILFNPLPGGADYVELYNNTGTAIPLKELRLAKMDGDSITKLYTIADNGLLEPRRFAVVTTDAAYVTANYTVRHPDHLIEVTSMPNYNDDKGCVVVATAGGIILDRFDYNQNMHSRLIRDNEGVALERRSFNAATNEVSNWYSAASTAGYGTPTYNNSQSREFLFLDDMFYIENALFSPDGDGYNDLLDITYNLQRCDLAANISIFDAHGRELRQLERGILLGCQGVLTWDGLDDNGHQCPRGNYIFTIEAYNESGAKQSWRRRVSLVRK